MSLIKQQHSYFMDTSGSGADSDVADLMVSKGYLPDEKYLPKASSVKNVDNDVTYLLSKLSDEELLKLLNDQPKKSVYDLNDIVRVSVDSKALQDTKNGNVEQTADRETNDNFLLNADYKGLRAVNPRGEKKGEAFFRLEEKPVQPFNTKPNSDENYAALQKIYNLLYSRPLEETQSSNEGDNEKKELLFDALVAQLKTLCCKKSKISKSQKNPFKSLLNDFSVQNSFYPKAYEPVLKLSPTRIDATSKEFMFLIINDEIKANSSEELISVDPESLEKNSSVLLLGPITTLMTNSQLKAVMTRISNELSKPDYLPLLQQISEGALSGSNIRLMKSLITGPETRRYIKPHRCNHQSPLARIHGGPKWIICTGYLNINTPSLYDKK